MLGNLLAESVTTPANKKYGTGFCWSKKKLACRREAFRLIQITFLKKTF
tara:strand:+ start:355 stop:501 length:147 start_codon:yes stop_codon:yes gene_type:complete